MNSSKEFEKFAVGHLGLGSNMLNEYNKFASKNSSIHNFSASLTPYILEERQMRMTQMDIFSRLMMDRVIWIGTPIDDRVSTVVQAQLLFLQNVDKKKVTSIYLDTPGGSVKSGLSIIDSMDNASFDVATLNTGMCASMGSVLLAGGTKGKRATLRFSKVMTHQVSHGSQGNVQDTRINQREAEKYNFLLFKRLGEYTGKSWQTVLEDSKNDKWFNSDEAKDYGLVDEIVIKKGDPTITEMMDGFDEYKKLMNI